VALGLALLVGTAVGARAQAPPIVVPVAKAIANVAERADHLLDAGQVRESLELLEARLASHPDDFESRWRAARAAVYMGILAQGTEIENKWYRRGMEHADLALAARPNDENALRWAIASKGSVAVQTGTEETVQLGEQVWTLTHRLLKIDPNDALAHDALGTLNYEVMKLSAFKRVVGRMLMGGNVLSKTSWDDALKHGRAAVTLDPGNILYRVDLAKTLAHLGKVDEALAQLRIAVSLPKRLPVDDDFRGRAEHELEVLSAREGR